MRISHRVAETQRLAEENKYAGIRHLSLARFAIAFLIYAFTALCLWGSVANLIAGIMEK